MNKIIILTFLSTIALIACKNPEKKIDNLQIAKDYYKALDNSDDSRIKQLLTDSLLTKETGYDYEQTFSLQEYMEWVKWDGIFDPSYEILEIVEVDTIVKAKISKIDKRIVFLHEAPIVTDQVIRFVNDKISIVETTKYVNFNDSIFVENRDKLVSWIDKNHPELKGFLYDQTEVGGRKYLKAIELYKSKE